MAFHAVDRHGLCRPKAVSDLASDVWHEIIFGLGLLRRPAAGTADNPLWLLQAYLAHAAHVELAAHFGQFLSAAIVYDFEMLAENGAELRGALEPFIGES